MGGDDIAGGDDTLLGSSIAETNQDKNRVISAETFTAGDPGVQTLYPLP